MSVEVVMSSNNLFQIQRILNFYKSLIVKNQNEATAAETETSGANFLRYQYAVQGSDTFLDYVYTLEDLVIDGGINPSDSSFPYFGENNTKRYTNSSDMNYLLFADDARAKKIIGALRQARIDSYVESNPYFMPFLGIPLDQSQYISVINDDAPPGTQPGQTAYYVFIQNVNEIDYPKTYDRLYVKLTINLIIAQYPQFLYLKFILNPMDPIYLRNCPQFTILYWDTNSLQPVEFDNFYEGYEKIRSKMLLVDYIQGYDNQYESYSNLMLFLLLHKSFLAFCNSYIRAFSLRHYTENEIYAILDSNGLSNLKTLDMDSVLRPVVENLPTLMQYKGTDQIIKIIINILDVSNIQIMRYKLKKSYASGSAYVSGLTTDEGYEKNVNLVFEEDTVFSNAVGRAISSIPTLYNYTDFVADDIFWGGLPNSSPSVRSAAQEAMKKKLLGMTFGALETKYMNVSRNVEILEVGAQVSDYLGLLFQYNRENNILSTSLTQFKDINVPPIALWAACCWGTALASGMPNANQITLSATSLHNVMLMRTTSGIGAVAAAIAAKTLGTGVINPANHIIDPESGLPIPNPEDTRVLTNMTTIGDIIKLQPGDTLTNYLVSFNLSSTTTLNDLFTQYKANSDIIKTVRSIIANTTTQAEFLAWSDIDKANTITSNMTNLFGGADTFDGFIQDVSPELFAEIEVVFSYNIAPKNANGTVNRDYVSNLTAFNSLMDLLNSAFSDFTSSVTNGIVTIPSPENISSGGDNQLPTIQALLTEFVSIYTELYKVDYNQIFSLPEENTIHPLYNLMFDLKKMNGVENLEPTHTILSSFLSSNEIDSLQLIEQIYDISESLFTELLIPNDGSNFRIKSSIAALLLTTGVDPDHVIGNKILESYQDQITQFSQGSESGVRVRTSNSPVTYATKDAFYQS